jgi:hypothetical protein
MTSIEFVQWAESLRELLAELETLEFDYPLGDNRILPPTTVRRSLPGVLHPLYEVCDGVSLPDVHVGYFIDPNARVASSFERGEPNCIKSDSANIDVCVFGSDGGGGRFAVVIDDRSVVYLPSSGAVRNGVYYEDSTSKPSRISDSVLAFLLRLNADVSAFICGEDGHPYMAR